MFQDFFNSVFGGMSGMTHFESPCAEQEAVRKQILLKELDEEVNALMTHYGITKDSEGKSATTTLAEISTVVYRARHRADAYSKVLNELYQRTGFRLEIINNKTRREENGNKE